MQSKNSIAARIGTLVFATSGIQFANGFFGTFIALRVASEDFGAAAAGLVLSSYFAGFTLGAFFSGRIIERFGHIRVYAAFAGMVIAATAVMPVLVEPAPWMVLRAAVGFGCAGLFVTTESWLSAKSGTAERGHVFSIYMVGTFVAIALGQLLIGRVEVASSTPFNIIVALFATALVLVSTTRAEQPQTVAAPHPPYGQLARAAPVAVAGAALSGLISGAFYALVPVWMQDEGIERETIGLFMLVAVLGGLAFQVPVALLSDRFDRRIVLVGLCTGLAVAAVALVRLPHAVLLILPAAALFGGLMSSLYPVCVAPAHGRVPAGHVVGGSSHLILASGCGSVLGPLIGMSVLRRFDINGVFYLMAAAALLLAVLAVGRILTSAAPLHLERTFRILAPQPTPLAHDPAGTAPPSEA